MKYVSSLLIIISFTASYSQSAKADYELLDSKIVTHEKQKNKPKFTLNPLKLTFRLGIGFYQKVVSEQIAANCAFELTCSRFSKSMVNEFGLLKGYFLTFDRLARCNAISPLETYPIRLNAKGRIIESPSDFRFH